MYSILPLTGTVIYALGGCLLVLCESEPHLELCR